MLREETEAWKRTDLEGLSKTYFGRDVASVHTVAGAINCRDSDYQKVKICELSF
jgi:hypothetical protein